MKYLFMYGTILSILLAVPAAAQHSETKRETIDDKEYHVFYTYLDVSPRQSPEPSLKYKLTWGFDQGIKANAASRYNMASRELTQYRYRILTRGADEFQKEFNQVLTDPEFFKEKKEALEEFEKKVREIEDDPEQSAETFRREASRSYRSVEYSYYATKPREEFPMEKARRFVEQTHTFYRLLEEGSRCDLCDWEYRIRGNTNPLSILIEEIQDAREMVRALTVKARVEIYDGRFEDAARTIRTGKALARHVAETPFIVSQLVGVAIDTQMNFCLAEWMRQPNAPNLYWSLTAMPPSLFSPEKPFTMEMDYVRLMVPELVTAMESPEEMSDEDWIRMDVSLKKALEDIGEEHRGGMNSLDFGGVVTYPIARQWMLDQGRTEEEIDKMSPAKVIGLWSVYRYEIHRDNALKVIMLPYWQMKQREKELEGAWAQSEPDKLTPLGRMVNMLFPATGGYMNALARSRQTREVLRIVEALRIYAAENDGKLPEKLERIQSVPIPPVDPFSGEAFKYRLEDGNAVIDSNAGYGIIRHVVKIRR